jgi:hypothetical protein
MTFHARLALSLPAAAILLWLAPASIASAQDVMQLDLEFKNSLSRGPSPEVREERRNEQGRRHKARDAQGPVAGQKRHARRRQARER